jgi:ATP-binding cassette subfamily C protein LapB
MDKNLSRRLYRFAGLKQVFPEVLISGLLINVLALALPLALLQMYDRIIPNQSTSTLGLLITGVIAALIFENVLRTLRGSVTSWLGARFEHRASVAGLRHLAEVPLREFSAREPGVYAEQLRAAGQVRDFYAGAALLVLLDLPFAVIYIAVIGLIGGWLAAVAVGLTVIFIAIASAYGAHLREKVSSRATQDDRRYNFLAETFSGIHSIKTMAMERLMHRRYEKLQETNVEQSSGVAQGSTATMNMGGLFTQIMTIGIVAAGSYLAVEGDITPGAMAGCIMLATRSLQPLRRSMTMWIRMQSFKVAQERLSKLFDLPTEVKDDTGKAAHDIKGGLTLRNVGLQFRGTEKPLFSDLSIDIKPGECVAIVGESGSGKSSLMAVMNGTLDIDSGDILIDGAPVEEFRESDLQQNIAYLPQRGDLVSGTIIENITMFDEDEIDNAIRVCEMLGLDSVIAGMRLGYETPVGDSAVDMMPAGVRQRISIAREILHDPNIILFDEANIAMDGEGDAKLRDYLESRKGEATIVLVAHRPSLMRLADRFFKLENGHLVETTAEDLRAALPDENAAVDHSPEPERFAWDLTDSVDHFSVKSDFSICLPALLTSLKWRGSPRRVAESLPHLVDTLDLSGFRSIMASLGYDSHAYRTRFRAIDKRLLPCLFVPENDTAKIVIDWTAEEGFRYFDPETVSVASAHDLGQTGEAFVFRFNEDADEEQARAREGWTKNVILRFKGFMLLTFAITLLSTVLSLATPLFVMGTFNFVLSTGDYTVQYWLIAGVCLAMGLDWVLKWTKGRIMAFMAGRSEFIIGNSIFQRILDLPAMSIERTPVSEQIARVKDLEALREFFIGPVATLAYELPALIIFVVVLAIINPLLVLVVVGLAAGYMLLGAASFGPQSRASNKATRLMRKRDEFMEETLATMTTVKAAGVVDQWIDRYAQLSGAAAMAEFKARRLNERISGISQFLSMAGGIGAMTVAGMGAMAGETSSGAILASMMIIWRLTGPIQNGFQSASTLIRVKNSLRQIDNLMQLNAEEGIEKSQSIRSAMKGNVSLSRVSFRYSMNADPALLGLSFDVEPGEFVAIAGPNGGGKSTLLKLMVRAYQPQAGSIRFDNVDIRQMSAARLREDISYMPQRCEVFYGTVAQNLRLAHPTATDEELVWAAEQADLLDEVMKLEQGSGDWKRTGFDVRISDSQSDQMPNGFRQRLGLARALLKPAPIMLFDEPGNGLDPEGDIALVRALKNLQGAHTIFLVSHRPSHLRLADRVIYLENGSIRAMGPFDNDNVKQVVMAGLG